MREIKFRGFDKENNCWRYGFYTKMLEGARIFHAIIVEDEDAEYRFTRWYIHSAKTVGQFTGLSDKNGKEIFEGDMVLIHFPEWGLGTVPAETIETIIVFKDYGFTCEIPANKKQHPVTHHKGLGVDAWQYEIIGDIHQDIHLLSDN